MQQRKSAEWSRMPLLKLSYPKWTNLKFIHLALLYSTCVSFFPNPFPTHIQTWFRADPGTGRKLAHLH